MRNSAPETGDDEEQGADQDVPQQQVDDETRPEDPTEQLPVDPPLTLGTDAPASPLLDPGSPDDPATPESVWAPSAEPTPSVPLTGQPTDPPDRQGPGWTGVIGLVLAGMIISSGATIGAVAAYDALSGPEEPAATAEPSATVPPVEASAVPASARDEVSWEQVASIISPSTVAIEVQGGDVSSEGTGVILAADGTVITNNHVVSGSDSLRVRLADGDFHSASIVGTDPSTDIAVIRIDSPPQGLRPATFADSEDVGVGQEVMAVGTPLGLPDTVTTGIISAVDRPVTTAGDSGGTEDATYTSALQTDAAINPGNSGGPLVNVRGEVIGINSSIAGLTIDEETSSGSIGLGFAIPSNTAMMIADQLREDGSADHAFLGVTTQNGERSIGEVTSAGAEVTEVTDGSAADAAGMQPEDLITEIDGISIEGSASLTGVIRGIPVGETVEIGLIRTGEHQVLEATLGASE